MITLLKKSETALQCATQYQIVISSSSSFLVVRVKLCYNCKKQEGYDMSITDIKKMPLIERLQLMERIWDTLRDESVEIDSPIWHEDILKERIDAHANGHVKSYTIEEIRQKIG